LFAEGVILDVKHSDAMMQLAVRTHVRCGSVPQLIRSLGKPAEGQCVLLPRPILA
jgi:hypothetical protein